MGIKTELGRKIKRMRQNRGFTQEQLAEAVDISQRTLSGIEIGENFVSAETLDKLINVLNITPDELFSVSHLRNPQELTEDIIREVKSLSEDTEKLEIIYKFVKSLKQD